MQTSVADKESAPAGQSPAPGITAFRYHHPAPPGFPAGVTTMKIGVNTMIWSGAFDSSIPLEAIRKAGIDGIEVPVFDATDLDNAALRRALADYGLGCTFCSVNPPGKNPISEDASIRAATLEHSSPGRRNETA